MDFLKTLQTKTTREQRVELMMAMLMKTDKVTWEKAQYRFRDALEVHLKSVIIVASLIAVMLITERLYDLDHTGLARDYFWRDCINIFDHLTSKATSRIRFSDTIDQPDRNSSYIYSRYAILISPTCL